MNSGEDTLPRTSFRRAAGTAARTLLDLLYPPLCRSCRRRIPEHDGRNFCDECWKQIEFIREPTCRICGASLEDYLPEGRKCPWCPLEEIAFDQAAAVARYDGVLREAIHWFKFRYKVGLKASLGKLMLQGLEDHYSAERFEVIVPVPLHWWRRRQREFNQAYLLAEPLAKAREIPLLEQLIVRRRRTRPQSRIVSHPDRRRNIAGAFAVREPDTLRGKSVLLVDDLYTSGSTVNECARVLKEAGAKRVCVLTLARAQSGGPRL